MITTLDCFPCFIKQTIIALSHHNAGREVGEEIVREVLSLMKEADTSRPPAYTTTFIHRLIRTKLGGDPFSGVKRLYNEKALNLYPSLKKQTTGAEDPLRTASRLAIAGNVIDFGIYTNIDMEGSISRSLADTIAVDDYPEFLDAIDSSENVLYLLDNAGEIVFDRLLIEELTDRGKKVTAVVKGAPVLNDVTLEDAVQAGLTSVCEVMDNGSDAIGTIIEWTSPEFQEAFTESELVISKGQGNFETVIPNGKRVFYLFQSKCDVVSKELGLPSGAMLLKKA